MSKFISDGYQEGPYAFLQWKGTDVCMDFHCDCGAHCHFDGDFAYNVRCPHCGSGWEMPCFVFPRKTDKADTAKTLEPDEDHCDEVIGADGITRLIPRPVSDTDNRSR